MGNYKNMSDYYDLIMKSGYYNYEKIVDAILRYQPLGNFLEIGCGTGLILELLAKIQPTKTIMGIDLTEEMLTIAQNRCQHFPNVFLSAQNIIDLILTEQYDIAFSYGGVWYFVIDGDQEPFLVSHLSSDTDNHKGFVRLAQYVSTGGKLLLGIQGPHCDYEKVIANGMKYSQKITPRDHGFIKEYYLNDGAATVMAQTIHYRTYSFAEAQKLLATYGFEYQPAPNNNKLFLEFKKL